MSKGLASARDDAIFLSKLSSASSSDDVLTKGIRPDSRACDILRLMFLCSLSFLPLVLYGLDGVDIIFFSKDLLRFSLNTP